MTARWMQAKIIKQRRERRAWAKPYSIKNSAGPNWHNGKIAKDTSLDVTEEIRLNNLKKVYNAKGEEVNRIPDITEIRREIPDALFVTTPCDTPHHRCRIYFDPRMTKYILQYVVWPKHQARISIAYPTAHIAWFRFLEDRVRWRKTIDF